MTMMHNFARLTHEWRSHLRQQQTARIVSALPFDIQRDIGWPVAGEMRPVRPRTLFD